MTGWKFGTQPKSADNFPEGEAPHQLDFDTSTGWMISHVDGKDHLHKSTIEEKERESAAQISDIMSTIQFSPSLW